MWFDMLRTRKDRDDKSGNMWTLSAIRRIGVRCIRKPAVVPDSIKRTAGEDPNLTQNQGY